MKNLLVLFVGSLLILAALQADAKRLTAEEKRKLQQVERQLAGEAKSGRNTDAAANKIPSGSSSTDGDEDDDDTNQSYGKYGNSNGSTPESHHYFTNDQKPTD
ncbi:hypothetical protein OWV82_005566 [Melia azedarach]|uniref:Uncharacterized protein n=1 Tax=Melia azedarach TaxID=155640 RepID=A0ACC1YER2_MELAZ|nr:hypothetical protein OWV82_005566 [Melia azedarach]